MVVRARPLSGTDTSATNQFIIAHEPAHIVAALKHHSFLYEERPPSLLGGSRYDHGLAIAVDGNNRAVVAGATQSSNFPTMANGVDTTHGRGMDAAGNPLTDAFVARLDNRFRGLLYASYLGGESADWARGVTLDSSDKLYLVGSSESEDFPTVSELDDDKGGDNCGNPPCPDVVIAKLDTAAVGSASLHFSSYLGGDSIDFGEGIALDADGDVYVAGTSFSEDFPTTAGVVGPSPDSYPDRRDVIVAKINMAGVAAPTSTLARYVYDAQGNRVKRILNGVVTHYAGAYFERQGNSTRKSYFFGGQVVAVRQFGVLSYLLSDHLGSTSVTLDSVGTVVSEQRYAPYGRIRSSAGSVPTDRRFTGQRFEGDVLGGLYDYGARFYDPNIGLFVQPDSIVPNPGRAVAFNRYAYTWNNPLKYTDPTGHAPIPEVLTSLFQSITGGTQYGFAPDLQAATARQKILDSTVIIKTYYRVYLPDGRTRLVYAYSLGTAIQNDVVLTHNHYGDPIRKQYPDAYHIELVDVRILDAYGNEIARYSPSDINITARGETTYWEFPRPLPGIKPYVNADNTLPGEGDTVLVAVLRVPPRGNPYVRVESATVADIGPDTIDFDYPVEPGSSGGGIFYNGNLIANNWSTVELTHTRITCRGRICDALITHYTGGRGALNP